MWPEELKKGVIYKVKVSYFYKADYILILGHDSLYVHYIVNKETTTLKSDRYSYFNSLQRAKRLTEIDALPEGVKFELNEHDKRKTFKIIFGGN